MGSRTGTQMQSSTKLTSKDVANAKLRTTYTDETSSICENIEQGAEACVQVQSRLLGSAR